MGRQCKIEKHPSWKIIVKRLVSGEEYSKIVQDYPDITWFDLDYYKENKLKVILSKSPEFSSYFD
jgi:uncharacterized protein (DUF433 family)